MKVPITVKAVSPVGVEALFAMWGGTIPVLINGETRDGAIKGFEQVDETTWIVKVDVS